MPIYEYECTKCGHQTEVWQKFSDPPMTKCELCRGKMRKLISQSAFHLKGTGWYVTDYASKRGIGKKESSKSEDAKTKTDAKSSTDQPKKDASSSTDKKA